MWGRCCGILNVNADSSSNSNGKIKEGCGYTAKKWLWGFVICSQGIQPTCVDLTQREPEDNFPDLSFYHPSDFLLQLTVGASQPEARGHGSYVEVAHMCHCPGSEAELASGKVDVEEQVRNSYI